MKVKEIRRKLSKYRTHYFRSKTAAVNTSPRQNSDFTHCATLDEDLGRIFFFTIFIWYVDFRRFETISLPAKVNFRGQRTESIYEIWKKEIPQGHFTLPSNPQNASCIRAHSVNLYEKWFEYF